MTAPGGGTMVSGIDDLRHDVQDLFGSARHAIDAQVDVPRWLEGRGGRRVRRRPQTLGSAEARHRDAARRRALAGGGAARAGEPGPTTYPASSPAESGRSGLVPRARPSSASVRWPRAPILGLVVGFLLDPVARAGPPRAHPGPGCEPLCVVRASATGGRPRKQTGARASSLGSTERGGRPGRGRLRVGSALEGGMPVADAERPAPA